MGWHGGHTPGAVAAKRGQALREAREKAPADRVIDMYRAAPDVPPPAIMLGPGGPLAKAIPGYRVREGQMQLSTAVWETFRDGGHLAAEAPTGIGKTIGALVGGIFHALDSNAEAEADKHGETPWRPLVYSTAQIALQDQAVFKDLPTLVKHSGLPFRFSYLKGRSNWACNLAVRDAINPRSRFAAWLRTDKSGDISVCPMDIPPYIREAITVEAEDCEGLKCPDYFSCYYYAARARCAGTHIVVVNHALLVANAMAGGVLIGRPCGLIIDEAHKLEEAARGILTLNVGPDLIHKIVKGALFAFIIDDAAANKCRGAAARFIREVKESFGDIKSAHRVVEPLQAEEFIAKAKALLKNLTVVRDELESARALAGSIDTAEQSLPSVRWLCEALTALTTGEMENWVAWVDRPTPRSNPEFHMAPLSVAPFMREHIWTAPSVMMSATMVSSESAGFATIVNAVGQPSPREMIAPAAFDFREQARYLLPQWRDFTRPPQGEKADADRQWCDAITGPMLGALGLTDGRAFCLFTSTTVMREMADRVQKAAPAHWTILVQDPEVSRRETMARYKAATNPILFGLKTFWEGVDIPGQLVSAVHIDKIPLPAPGEPMTDALKDLHGGFPRCLHAFDIPHAILDLKQAIGRGIRLETCRCLYVLYDPRLRHANYRQTILRALPGWVSPLPTEEIDRIPGWIAGTGPAPRYEVPF